MVQFTKVANDNIVLNTKISTGYVGSKSFDYVNAEYHYIKNIELTFEKGRLVIYVQSSEGQYVDKYADFIKEMKSKSAKKYLKHLIKCWFDKTVDDTDYDDFINNY